MTELELRCLTHKNNEVFAVYNGKIVNSGAIGHLKNLCDCSRRRQDDRLRKEEPTGTKSDSE